MDSMAYSARWKIRDRGKSVVRHSRGKRILETPNTCHARDSVDVLVHGCIFNHARTGSLRRGGPAAISDRLLP